MTKRVSILLLIAMIAVPAFSASSEDLLQIAKSGSTQIKTAEMNRTKSLMNLTEMDKPSEIGINVASGSISTTIDGRNTSVSMSPSVNLTFPNDEDPAEKTSLNIATGPMSMSLDSFSINPSISASHTFNFNYVDEKTENLNRQRNLLTADENYESAIISFEKTFYMNLKNLVTQEKNIRQLENTVENNRVSLDNLLKSKALSEESLTYKTKKNQIRLNEQSLESARRSFDLSKQSFFNAYGIEYEGIDSVSEVSLEVPEIVENSSVLKAQIAMDLAQQQLDNFYNMEKANNLTLNAKIDGSYYSYAGIKTPNKIGGSIGVSYNKDNFTVGAKTDLSYNISNSHFSPSITVSGSWHNDSGSSYSMKGEEMLGGMSSGPSDKTNKEIMLQNDLLEKQYSYSNTLMQLSQDITNLQNRVIDYIGRKENLEIEKQFKQAELDIANQLLEAGLEKPQTIEEIEFALAQFEYDEKLMNLEGHMLECDIRILEI